MKKAIEWFKVDRCGLAELQEGKPKSYVLRELIANAWDEDIKECKVGILWDKGTAILSVEDDSPVGFRDLADSYTLFGHTYKRADPTKRGRFNLGEKQAFSICEEAVVESTTGTVIFDKRGRTKTNKKRKTGSRVMLKLKAKKSEYKEMLESIKLYHPPTDIEFYVNGERINPQEPVTNFKTKLTTELESNGALRRTMRNTAVEVYEPNGTGSWLYEMGIPVTEINCGYSIDVQQKIPLGIDRETISEAFLKVLYAEVLNHTFEEIKPDTSSELWVRSAMGSKRVNNEAVKGVIEKRFGKACIANPFDKNSIDEAVSHGFNVIHGSEMSKEEWDNVKESGALQTTSQLFGAEMRQATRIKPTNNMKQVADYAKAIAKKCIGINIKVEFVESDATTLAQFGDEKLTFNVSRLGKDFFSPAISEKTTDLILHELGHHAGHHTETSYHELITKIGAKLVMVAINEPKFFKELN